MERFWSINFIQERKQKSKYAKATTQSMQVFCQWEQKKDHLKNIGVLAPDALDSILQHFFVEIDNKDGSNAREER